MRVSELCIPVVRMVADAAAGQRARVSVQRRVSPSHHQDICYQGTRATVIHSYTQSHSWLLKYFTRRIPASQPQHQPRVSLVTLQPKPGTLPLPRGTRRLDEDRVLRGVQLVS